MTTRSILVPALGVGLSFSLVLASVDVGETACNSLPPASEYGAGYAQIPPVADLGSSTPQPLPANLEGAFRYKAALGRVDGVFFVPGEGERLRLAADGLCVGEPIEAAAPYITDIGPISDLAVFVAFDAAPGHAVPVFPYTAAKNPPIAIGALEGALLDRSRAHGEKDIPPVYFVFGDHWDSGVHPVPIAPGRGGVGGVGAVGIDVPSLVDKFAAVAVERASWNLDSSSVRVLAIHMEGKDAQELAGDVAMFLSSSCSAICGKLKPQGAAVCLDRIYSRPLPPDGAAQFLPYAEDKMLCGVDIPQAPLLSPLPPLPGHPAQKVQRGKHNRFAAICEPDSAFPAVPHPQPKPGEPPVVSAVALTPLLASCEETQPKVKLWRSECGGIHIPLDYSNIRVRERLDGSGRTLIKRRLFGQSAVGRGTEADEKRIYVPGREFIGSTPTYDSSASSPDTKWRLPNLDVWYPDGQESAEFGLTGVADKDESIIHIFPRMPAIFVCPSPDDVQPIRGCMGVQSGGVHCACEDSEAAGCTCEHLHSSGQFFACDGGDRTNMPCTRDEHCKSRDLARDDGRCSRTPICRAANTVWRRKPKNDDPDPPGAQKCSTDEECGTGQQCGYSLFDFKDRLADDGWYYLDRDIVVPPTENRIRRGACAQDHELMCNNNAASPNVQEVCPQSGRCRGYRLGAGQEEP